jgi:hypothetical protein
MSRTIRTIPHYLKPRVNEDNNCYSPALAAKFSRYDAKLGRDGAVKTSTCGHDASHPSGYNSWDDLSCGKGKRWDKRMASHARRRYSKAIVDADVQIHFADFDDDIAEQIAFDKYYEGTELKGFDFDQAAVELEDERFKYYDECDYEVHDCRQYDNDNDDYGYAYDYEPWDLYA